MVSFLSFFLSFSLFLRFFLSSFLRFFFCNNWFLSIFRQTVVVFSFFSEKSWTKLTRLLFLSFGFHTSAIGLSFEEYGFTVKVWRGSGRRVDVGREQSDTLLFVKASCELRFNCCDRMASTVAITRAMTGLDRAFLLRRLGIPADTPMTGDIADASPINLDAGSSLKVYLDDAPFINFGATHERCSGARMLRFQRATVTIPCFEQKFVAGETLCECCSEL